MGADTSVAVPDSGSAKIDAEAVRTEAGTVDRQRVAVTGDLLVRLVEGIEDLVEQQRLTNLILQTEFRTEFTPRDLKRK